MTPFEWAVAIGALALIAFVNWFFLGKKEKPARRGHRNSGA